MKAAIHVQTCTGRDSAAGGETRKKTQKTTTQGRWGQCAHLAKKKRASTGSSTSGATPAGSATSDPGGFSPRRGPEEGQFGDGS